MMMNGTDIYSPFSFVLGGFGIYSNSQTVAYSGPDSGEIFLTAGQNYCENFPHTNTVQYSEISKHFFATRQHTKRKKE
jgi:hypothetical protein